MSYDCLIQDGEQSSDTTTADKKTESMSKLIDELNNMSSMIDTDKNPQWKYMMQSPTKEPGKYMMQSPTKEPGKYMMQSPTKEPGKYMMQSPTKEPGK